MKNLYGFEKNVQDFGNFKTKKWKRDWKKETLEIGYEKWKQTNKIRGKEKKSMKICSEAS